MSGNFQSSYTGTQLDAAIASYVNRSTGTIILDPDHLAKSLGAGYYSGVSASLDYSGLTATSGNLLTGTTAIGANGKMSGGMSSGNVSFTLTPSSLSQTSSPNKYVPSASASLNYSSLTAGASDVAQGKLFIGQNGYAEGTASVAQPPQMGIIKGNNDKSITISGLTGTPDSVMIVLNGSTAANNEIRRAWHIGSETDSVHNCFYSSKGNYTSEYSTAGRVYATFDHSAGTCTVWGTLSSFVFRSSSSPNYIWIVWKNS